MEENYHEDGASTGNLSGGSHDADEFFFCRPRYDSPTSQSIIGSRALGGTFQFVILPALIECEA